jgi:hypothetical protein
MWIVPICWPAICAAVLYVTVLVAITTVAFKARSWGDVVACLIVTAVLVSIAGFLIVQIV